jgi:hypothetical protein
MLKETGNSKKWIAHPRMVAAALMLATYRNRYMRPSHPDHCFSEVVPTFISSLTPAKLRETVDKCRVAA